MALPELRWYASDGVTALATLDLQPVGPGEDYATKYGAAVDFVVKNDGALSLTVTVEILQVAGYPIHEYLRIAAGEVTPGAYVDYLTDPLALGTLAAGASARVWVDVIVPPGADRAYGELANLRALGV